MIPTTFLWNAAHLDRAKQEPGAHQSALGRLRKEADEALTFAPVSVMDKTQTPPSGDKHDYMSRGPYWWPNPDTPDGLPFIRRDGEVHPESSQDRQRLGPMCSRVETLSLAAYLFNEASYAEHAATLLRTWFLDDATRMHPHLEYGQAIPGICDGRGIGIIDTAGTFTRLVDGLGVLDQSNAWTEADRNGLMAWMRAYLTWLQESGKGKDEAATSNNHATYFDMQAVAIALYTGQPEIARRIIQAVPETRITPQVEPDGAQPHELARTNSRGYSMMNTMGFIHLGILAEHLGEDLWHFETPDGRGIRKAIDWFIPYIRDEKAWTWQQIHAFTNDRYAPLFRQAAVAYPDAPYQEILNAVAPDDFAAHRITLTAAPLQT